MPHLHLWRSLTDRPMSEWLGTPGGFYKESGLTLEQALALKWDGTDPELKAKRPRSSSREGDREEAASGTSEGGTSPPPEQATGSSSKKSHALPWVIAGVLLVGILATLFKARRS